MHEIIINTHVHTYLSDGHATYQEIANAAVEAGINGVIITDHNVFVQRKEGFYSHNEKKVVILSGQEIHDQYRNPQKNHLLVFQPKMDYSIFAQNPSQLIQKIKTSGALSFIAHPVDPELKVIGEPNISWEDWNISGFTGIELWNGFSEIKFRSHNFFQLLFYVLFPDYLTKQPLPATLKLWDSLLADNKCCVAIGGSDAHAIQKRVLGLHKVIFPYTHHFRAINNHLLLNEPLSLEIAVARKQILQAFKNGNLFIGYDKPYPTKGFRFYGQGLNQTFQIGDKIDIGDGITLQINLPIATECNLLRNGEIVKSWTGTTNCTYITKIPGIYRVEANIQYRGSRRGWIYTNPIVAG
jgi:hypothetical protein